MLLQLSMKNGLEHVKRDETTERLLFESRGIRSFRPYSNGELRTIFRPCRKAITHHLVQRNHPTSERIEFRCWLWRLGHEEPVFLANQSYTAFIRPLLQRSICDLLAVMKARSDPNEYIEH